MGASGIRLPPDKHDVADLLVLKKAGDDSLVSLRKLPDKLDGVVPERVGVKWGANEVSRLKKPSDKPLGNISDDSLRPCLVKKPPDEANDPVIDIKKPPDKL